MKNLILIFVAILALALLGSKQVMSLYDYIDRGTNALLGIDYVHHEIHAGSHFYYTDSNTLNSGDTTKYVITTPNTTKWSHFIKDIDGVAVTKILIYEGSTKTGTTPQTIFNNDRSSLTANTTTIAKGFTGAINGTLIYTYNSGAASAQSRTPSSSRNEDEIILKQGTKYLVLIISGTASNLTNTKFAWYEHTNKI